MSSTSDDGYPNYNEHGLSPFDVGEICDGFGFHWANARLQTPEYPQTINPYDIHCRNTSSPLLGSPLEQRDATVLPFDADSDDGESDTSSDGDDDDDLDSEPVLAALPETAETMHQASVEDADQVRESLRIRTPHPKSPLPLLAPTPSLSPTGRSMRSCRTRSGPTDSVRSDTDSESSGPATPYLPSDDTPEGEDEVSLFGETVGSDDEYGCKSSPRYQSPKPRSKSKKKDRRADTRPRRGAARKSQNQVAQKKYRDKNRQVAHRLEKHLVDIKLDLCRRKAGKNDPTRILVEALEADLRGRRTTLRQWMAPNVAERVELAFKRGKYQ